MKFKYVVNGANDPRQKIYIVNEPGIWNEICEGPVVQRTKEVIAVPNKGENKKENEECVCACL